jgi:anti-sigma regulatory factor (Ser/Thr protein kinase)
MERAMVTAAAREEAAAREHAIAHFLQRSLLPERTYDLEQLEVATYYRAGVEGTEVGGDWYDVIELGPGRVALVVGDVMGRGVIAASVMGQMRSAVRTLARLGMSPGDVVEQLDAFVSELDDYQMVTCVYAVVDSTARTLSYANAGHVPPLLLLPDGGTVWLHANTPPLGAGADSATTLQVDLVPETRVVLYTDGLVEERGVDLAEGMAALEEQARLVRSVPVGDLPARLVGALRPDGSDDVALLVTRVNEEPVLGSLDHRVDRGEDVIGRARRLVTDRLRTWELPQRVVEEVTMTSNELVTNAVVHGTPPVDIRVVRTARNVVVEVTDANPERPRPTWPAADEEHGRGLRVVEGVATRWGVRPAPDHKTVWCSHRLSTLTPDGD